MERIWLYLIISVLCINFTLSQSDSTKFVKNPTIIGVNVDYGFILKHTSSLREIGNAYPSAISIDWSQLLLTQNAWEFCNCFPRIGIDLALWNLDNQDVLGNGILIMSYVEPYFRTQKKLIFFLEWV